MGTGGGDRQEHLEHRLKHHWVGQEHPDHRLEHQWNNGSLRSTVRRWQHDEEETQWEQEAREQDAWEQ